MKCPIIGFVELLLIIVAIISSFTDNLPQLYPTLAKLKTQSAPQIYFPEDRFCHFR